MKRLIMKPTGFECTFGECPPGFFIIDDELCLKSDYQTKTPKGYKPDAYLDNGSYFCGGVGVDTIEKRNALKVLPVEPVWEDFEE